MYENTFGFVKHINQETHFPRFFVLGSTNLILLHSVISMRDRIHWKLWDMKLLLQNEFFFHIQGVQGLVAHMISELNSKALNRTPVNASCNLKRN